MVHASQNIYIYIFTTQYPVVSLTIEYTKFSSGATVLHVIVLEHTRLSNSSSYT
jgi:hypothetical protein